MYLPKIKLADREPRIQAVWSREISEQVSPLGQREEKKNESKKVKGSSTKILGRGDSHGKGKKGKRRG